MSIRRTLASAATAIDLNLFGRSWRRTVIMAGLYVIGLSSLPAIIDTVGLLDAETKQVVTASVAILLAPAVAALLAIRATTDERVRLAVPVSLIWFATSAGLLGPGIAATVASANWIDGFAIDTGALGAAVAGFILVGGLWRAIYLGDEDFVRPWTSALGDARWMTMQDATNMLPADADVVIGEAYMPFKERRGTQEFHPGRTATWGSGGKAPILAYDLSFNSTHMLFFAGSGGYKTTSTVVPTARRYSGSMVVLDPALEIGEMVAPVRRRLRGPNGKQRRVITIDPESNAIQGCDVLELLRESKRQELVIGSYANMLLTEKPKASSGADAFFEGNNYGLMSGLLMYVLHGRAEDYEGRKIQRPTLRQLRTLTALPEAQLKSLIGDIYANTGVSSVRGYIADEAARTFIRQSLAPFVTMAQDSWTGICRAGLDRYQMAHRREPGSDRLQRSFLAERFAQRRDRRVPAVRRRGGQKQRWRDSRAGRLDVPGHADPGATEGFQTRPVRAR